MAPVTRSHYSASNKALPVNQVEEPLKQATKSDCSIDALPETPIELSVFEFTLFPKLPIELRTLVWEHIFLESRVIRVSEDTSRDPQTGPIGRRRVKATLTVPPALHVYRESRSIATKHYTMSFGTQLSGNGV